MNRTKIVATIGPASADYKTLKKMAQAGMDVCRLNFSHNSHQSHRELIKNIRRLRKELGIPLTILQDLQGPKLRVADVGNGGIRVQKNEKIILVNKKDIHHNSLLKTKNTIIPVGFNISKIVKKNNKILIHDGLIELKVIKKEKGFVFCRIIVPGVIFSHKGINIPGIKIKNSVLTEKDKKDLKFGLQQKVDWIALSFVRSPQDIQNLRKLIKKYSPQSQVKIIAKIERAEAVKKINKIIQEADGIMVARGDLGVEINIEKVPIIQKDIIKKCMKLAKPVIVATQMLESMIKNLRPTRAEVSDVANAVIDHTDAVMLSGETAYGKYPVEVIKMMNKIISKTEASVYDDLTTFDLVSKMESVFTISESVQTLVANTKAKAVLIKTKFGYSARVISSFRPETEIVALVNNETIARELNISWGIYPLNIYKYNRYKNFLKIINKSLDLIKKKKIVKKNDFVIIVNTRESKKLLNLIKLT